MRSISLFNIMLVVPLMGMAATAIWLNHRALVYEREIMRLNVENAMMSSAITQRRQAKLALESDRRSGGDANLKSGINRDVDAVLSATADEAVPIPVRSYLNLGQTTAVDALQTMAWACDQGDTTTMANLFIIDEEARFKADEIYAAIPDKMKEVWKSVEAFAAAIIVHNGIEQPYPGSRVLALATIKPLGSGRVALVLPMASVSNVVFQQTKDGWKYVIRETVVDDYIARVQAETRAR